MMFKVVLFLASVASIVISKETGKPSTKGADDKSRNARQLFPADDRRRDPAVLAINGNGLNDPYNRYGAGAYPDPPFDARPEGPFEYDIPGLYDGNDAASRNKELPGPSETPGPRSNDRARTSPSNDGTDTRSKNIRMLTRKYKPSSTTSNVPTEFDPVSAGPQVRFGGSSQNPAIGATYDSPPSGDYGPYQYSRFPPWQGLQSAYGGYQRPNGPAYLPQTGYYGWLDAPRGSGGQPPYQIPGPPLDNNAGVVVPYGTGNLCLRPCAVGNNHGINLSDGNDIAMSPSEDSQSTLSHGKSSKLPSLKQMRKLSRVIGRSLFNLLSRWVNRS